MQFDVSNVCRTCDRAEVQEKIAKQLHTKPFTELNQGKIVNFDVFLFRAPPGEWSIHGGHGKLVLPTPQIGEAFMSKFMGNAAPKRVIVGVSIELHLVRVLRTLRSNAGGKTKIYQES